MVARILLADSSEQSRAMLVKLLDIYGFGQVSQAQNGSEALLMLKEGSFDLAIIDVGLEGVDGLFVSEIVRFVPRFREVKIVLLSNSVNDVLMKKAMGMGVHAFLERPINAENVKHVVQLLSPTSDFSKPDLPPSINQILGSVGACAQRNLTLLFKSPARILKVEPLSEQYATKSWDLIATTRLMGQVQLQISACATLASAKALAQATSQKESGALDVTLSQFLDGIIERSLPDIKRVFAIQTIQSERSAGLVNSDPNAEYRFVIQLRVGFESTVLRKQLAIPLYVNVTLT